MRPRKRDARRALLIGVWAYLALQVGISLALATELSWLRSPVYEYKKHALEARLKFSDPHTLKVVMFGSSRVLQGLRSDRVEEALEKRLEKPLLVYNFGVAGAGPFMQMFYLRRLLADGIRPELVLLEVLPALLGDTSTPRDIGERQLPIEGLRREELPLVRRYANGSRSIDDTDWWLAWAYPAYAHRFAFVSHTAPILLSFSQRLNAFRDAGPSGWLPPDMSLYTSGRRLIALERARQEYAANLAAFQPGRLPLSALRESLDLCREAGVKVALVAMPEGPVFRSWYSLSTQNQLADLYDDLRGSHGVPLVDASTWLDSEKHFIDSHHLTPDGAALFSRQLAERALPSLIER